MADFVAKVAFSVVHFGGLLRPWACARRATVGGVTGGVRRSRKARDRCHWRRARHKLAHSAQVLSDCCQRELELGATGTPQTQAAEPQDAFEMGEQHLDLLAIATRLGKRLGLGETAGDIARGLINTA
jgi:hypothetical protein